MLITKLYFQSNHSKIEEVVDLRRLRGNEALLRETPLKVVPTFSLKKKNFFFEVAALGHLHRHCGSIIRIFFFHVFNS